MEFISVQDAARLWNISPRRIQKLCGDGRIEGVSRFGRNWMIPKNAEKPLDLRKSRGKRGA